MKRERNERSHKDPVCGMEVSPIAAVDQLIHEGKTYYFCSEACSEAFEAEPARYLRHHRQHGM
ncbi:MULTISPECIES: YHS domain-containing protein [Marinobacter]|uniref:YHS domain-containing protein n=1 Tax=Marinobacter metalliresistant TaxID=2961995 RepID=A0ABZ2VXB2_9GAMM|nr:YHS domain-containing protein [Marinobacter sp. Arc7-DN-1]AXS83608.1 YHS domain-containing protein [Marinobacter sp. Arc7-DN-1]